MSKLLKIKDPVFGYIGSIDDDLNVACFLHFLGTIFYKTRNTDELLYNFV